MCSEIKLINVALQDKEHIKEQNLSHLIETLNTTGPSCSKHR